MKTVIVYKGKYGATAQYAQWLSQILNVPVYKNTEIDDAELNEYDVVIAGGSVYAGKIQIAKWINKRTSVLANKHLFLFVVCGSPDASEAEHSVMLSRNIDKTLLNRMSVSFLKGKMTKHKLSFSDYLILRIGAILQKSKADRKRMLTNFDGVRKENLKGLLETVESLLLQAG